MPKCKYTQTKEEKQAEILYEKENLFRIELAGMVSKIKADKHYKQNQIAEEAGFSASTFSEKLRDPKRFTMGEFIRLCTRFPEISECFNKCANYKITCE